MSHRPEFSSSVRDSILTVVYEILYTLFSKDGLIFFSSLSGSDDDYSFTSSKNGDVQKIETVTLAELNNYVLNSPPQVRPLSSFYSYMF